ncbi:MAG: hypothetical protein AB2689_05205 [Candidatus Thiodiazotropha taylori]
MNKFTLIITAASFSALGFACGTYYGFKEGINNLGLLEQIAQGALSRHQLASIETKNLENVVHLFELNIDSGLHRYVAYQESGNKFLSEHFMPEMTSSLDSYVDLMAEYRKDHPIVFGADWALPVNGDDEETRKWREQGYNESVEMLSEIKELLRSRGVPESALKMYNETRGLVN